MQDYLLLKRIGEKLGDDGFCTVNALATVTGYSFKRCQRKLAKHGRKFRRGAGYATQHEALKAFGYSSKRMYNSSLEVTKSGRLRTVGLTANQFAQKYNKGTYYVRFHGSINHVACLVDGVYNDWIDKKYRGKAPQFIVYEAYSITKKCLNLNQMLTHQQLIQK